MGQTAFLEAGGRGMERDALRRHTTPAGGLYTQPDKQPGSEMLLCQSRLVLESVFCHIFWIDIFLYRYSFWFYYCLILF